MHSITITSQSPTDLVSRYALQNIGDAETIAIEVIYEGYEEEPDILTVDRKGEIIAARSLNA